MEFVLIAEAAHRCGVAGRESSVKTAMKVYSRQDYIHVQLSGERCILEEPAPEDTRIGLQLILKVDRPLIWIIGQAEQKDLIGPVLRQDYRDVASLNVPGINVDTRQTEECRRHST